MLALCGRCVRSGANAIYPETVAYQAGSWTSSKSLASPSPLAATSPQFPVPSSDFGGPCSALMGLRGCRQDQQQKKRPRLDLLADYLAVLTAKSAWVGWGRGRQGVDAKADRKADKAGREQSEQDCSRRRTKLETAARQDVNIIIRFVNKLWIMLDK